MAYFLYKLNVAARIVKPGARKGRAHLISWNYFGLRVSVCVSAPEGINN